MKNSIQVIAPASYALLTAHQKKAIENFFIKKGWNFDWGANTFKKTTVFGATDAERLSDLTQAFKKNTSVVMALRGGYGSARLLSKINWDLLKKSNSLFAGFSDLTTFQNAYYTKTSKPSITGMIATYLKETPDQAITTSFFNILQGGDIDFKGLPHIIKGAASGILIGGNLTCFESLIGTGRG